MVDGQRPPHLAICARATTESKEGGPKAAPRSHEKGPPPRVLVASPEVPQSATTFALAVGVAWAGLLSCGEQGLLPTTVDPGSDFVQADVVFDDQFFYCRVEPVLFQQSCGPGVMGMDAANGCHFSVTKFRLTDYMPLVAETSCSGDALAPGAVIPVAAQQNYTAAQARMKRDPNLAALLQRPIGAQQHPRKIFEESSAEADVIRQWATQFSSQ